MKRLTEIKMTTIALRGLLTRIHIEKHPLKKQKIKMVEELIEYWEAELLKE